MSGSVFREAVTPQEAATAPAPVVTQAGDSVSTHVPELLATYQEDQGLPYTAEYFDLKNVWDKTENLATELKGIDKYLQELVADGKLDNSTKTASKYLADMEKKAGVNPFDTPNKRISRLTAYIQFRRTVDA